MEDKKGVNFIFVIVAFILGITLFKHFNFKTCSFKMPALDLIFLITFIAAIYLIIKDHRKQKNKKTPLIAVSCAESAKGNLKDIMNEEKKNALNSLLFYAIALVAIVAINVSGAFKSGPCTPNLDFFSVFIVVILNVILLIVNGIKAFLLKKQTRLSFAIHFVVLIIWLVWFNCEVG